MTEYLDHIAIARQLLEQQGEINTLQERAGKAEVLLEALGWEKCGPCGNWVEPLGMVLHFRAEHATAEDLAESTPLPPFPYHLARCMGCDALTDDCTCGAEGTAVAGPATGSKEQQ